MCAKAPPPVTALAVTPDGIDTRTGVSLLSVRAVAELTVGVQAPGVEVSVRADGVADATTAGDGNRLHAGGKRDDHRCVAVCRAPVAELTVEIVAPGVEVPVRADGVGGLVPAATAFAVTPAGRETTHGCVGVGRGAVAELAEADVAPGVEVAVRTDGVRCSLGGADGRGRDTAWQGDHDGRVARGRRGGAVAELARWSCRPRRRAWSPSRWHSRRTRGRGCLRHHHRRRPRSGTTPAGRETVTGASAFEVEPLPSSPVELSPQAKSVVTSAGDGAPAAGADAGSSPPIPVTREGGEQSGRSQDRGRTQTQALGH